MRPRPRPELADLTPYKTSDVATGRIWLHANENPYPPPDDVVAEIFSVARTHELNRYPEPGTALAEELAAYAGVDTSQIWIGDGSNEVLLQACLAFGGPDRKALVFEPTYRMHYRQARMAGTDVVIAERGSDFAIDPYAACEAIEAEQPDIVFVCSPNNPTGTVTPIADIERIADCAPGLVIVDEAYFEFSKSTFLDVLPKHDNVMVVRTMSKAFRLAAVRLGYGIANADLLNELARVRMPYAQSAFTQTAALVALRNRDVLLEKVPELISQRDRLASHMSGRGIQVYGSGGNFLLFRHADPQALLDALATRGVVIRDFRTLPGAEGCLRVSVGTPEQNDEFLSAVDEVAT